MTNDNEIVVARLSGGASIVMKTGPDDLRVVKVLLRRNKHAKLPSSRILFKTGIFADDFSEILKFREEASDLVPEIDIRSLWESVKHSDGIFSIQKLTSIYWKGESTPQRCAALILVIESKESIYFDAVENRYSPRENLKVMQLEKRIQADRKLASEGFEFSEILRGIRKFSQLTDSQKRLLGYLREYAIGGENDLNGSTAKEFMQKHKFSGDLRRTAFDLLLKIGELKLDDPIELERENVRIEFPEGVLEEVKLMGQDYSKNDSERVDLRDLDVFTIDNAHTTDRDDAISVTVLSRDINGFPDQVQVGVHIADASHAISLGGLVDSEAEKRMSSIYLPEKTVCMIPEFLIDNFAGLNPGLDRSAITLLVDFSNTGEILNWEIIRSLINSKVAMSYQEADSCLENDTEKWNQQISIMNLLANKLKNKRIKNGALHISHREMEIKFSETGQVVVTISKGLKAREAVAEFMILYNHLVAQYCHNFNIPAIYRSQLEPQDFDRFDSYSDGPFKNYLLFKQLEPVLGANAISNHWGLALQGYIQSTSPLRRYTDLVMQRQIANHIQYSAPIYSLDSLSLIFLKSIEQFKSISRLESERVKFWFSKFLFQKSNSGDKIFPAVVLENRSGRNALLELENYPFKIRIRLNKSILPGDHVSLEFEGVDWLLRQPKFEVIRDCENVGR